MLSPNYSPALNGSDNVNLATMASLLAPQSAAVSVPTTPRTATNADYKLSRIIDADYATRLTYNEDTGEVLLDEKLVNLAVIRKEITDTHQVSVNRETLNDFLQAVAMNHPFSPLEQALQSLRGTWDGQTDYIAQCADEVLHTTDVLDTILLRRFFIAAVARVFQPGCKMDTTLFLQGEQGTFKSTFFRVLAGDAFFDEFSGDVSAKDALMKLHRSWLTEWAELETVLRRSGEAKIKGFLSAQEDKYRPPYGRQLLTLKRRSVIVGTTNQREFLTDPTGNRRFWVIPVREQINIARLKEIRDGILAQAIALFDSGEQWHLTVSEEAEMRKRQQDFKEEDLWTDSVVAWASQQTLPFSTTDVMNGALGVETRSCDRKDAQRIGGILTASGFRQASTRLPGNTQPRRLWVNQNQNEITATADIVIGVTVSK